MMHNAKEDDIKERDHEGSLEWFSKQVVYALTLFMLAFEYFQIIDNGW